MTERSDLLRAHCAKYYSAKTDCSGCRIQAVCWDGPRDHLTLKKLDAHTERMNVAAKGLV
jgi:hypothetical protein